MRLHTGVCGHCRRFFNEISGRKIPCRTGELNPHRQHVGLMLYQLSYIPTSITDGHYTLSVSTYLSACPSGCLPVCPFVTNFHCSDGHYTLSVSTYLSACPYACLSACPFVTNFHCLDGYYTLSVSTYMSACPSGHLSVCPFVTNFHCSDGHYTLSVSTYLSACPSARLSACPFVTKGCTQHVSNANAKACDLVITVHFIGQFTSIFSPQDKA